MKNSKISKIQKIMTIKFLKIIETVSFIQIVQKKKSNVWICYNFGNYRITWIDMITMMTKTWIIFMITEKI